MGRKNTSRSATSSWLLLTGKFGYTFYSPGRSSVLVSHFLFSPSRRLTYDESVQFTEFLSSYPRSSEDLDTRSQSQTSSLFHHMSSLVSLSRKQPDYHADDSSVPAIILLAFAYFSDKLRLRWPFILAGLLSSAVGFAINISNASHGVKYFGTFLCVAGSYSATPGIVAW